MVSVYAARARAGLEAHAAAVRAIAPAPAGVGPAWPTRHVPGDQVIDVVTGEEGRIYAIHAIGDLVPIARPYLD